MAGYAIGFTRPTHRWLVLGRSGRRRGGARFVRSISSGGRRRFSFATLATGGTPFWDVRENVAVVLGYHPQDSRALLALITLSRDEESRVRDWATFELGCWAESDGIDTPAMREALAERLEDSDFDTHGEALAAMAFLRDPRGLEPLRGALSADEVGSLAVEAAETLKEPSLLPFLLDFRSWWDVDSLLLERAIIACSGE